MTTGSLTVREALALPPIAAGQPELLSEGASLQRTIRWAHVIGDPRPGQMLEGGELVLSTLPLLQEDREDLHQMLRRYLEDLDAVGAAALVVEVLADRPQLISALEQVSAERTARHNSATLTPVLRFPQVVRFVEITELLHRELVSQQLQLDREDETRDPLISSTSALFDELASSPPLDEDEATSRARSLGMPHTPALVPMTFVFDPPAISERHRGLPVQDFGMVIRQAAARQQIPVLVGFGPPHSVSAIVGARAGTDPQQAARRLCQAVDQAVRGHLAETLPRHTAAMGEVSSTFQHARQQLDEAWEVGTTAASLRGRDVVHPEGSHTQTAELWTAGDIRLWGVLTQLADDPAVTRFLEAELRLLQELNQDGEEQCQLIEALVSTRGTKAELARYLGISRPTLYSRLESLQRRLGRSLDDGETLTTLHVALMLNRLKDTSA